MRTEKNLSRRELANLIDISQQVITNIEAGRTKITSLRNYEFYKLCFHLSCTKDFLLGLSDDPIKNKNGTTQSTYKEPDINDLDTLSKYVKEFPEAFQLLCKLTNILSTKERELLIKILNLF